MELVVDANILVAGFLRAATTRELLLDERLTLWAPEYALLETQRILLTPRIQRKFGKLSPEQVKLALATTTASIQVLPEATHRAYLPEAKELAADPADAPYLALALHLNLPIWSVEDGQTARRIWAGSWRSSLSRWQIASRRDPSTIKTSRMEGNT